VNKRHITWSEFGDLSDLLAKKIASSNKKFDGIIGISRGGLPLTTILSHTLSLPISLIIRAASYDEDNEQ